MAVRFLPPRSTKPHSIGARCTGNRVLSAAVNMLGCGHALTDIKNRLGHENIQSTMVYLHMDLASKQAVQKKFIQYATSALKLDPKLDALIDWDHKQDILSWLDSL